MGLLDWLTEGVGSDMGGSSMGMAGNPPPMLPAPPQQQTGVDAPPLPSAMGQDPVSAGLPPVPPPMPPGTDPMTAGGPAPGGSGPGLPFAPGGDPMTAGGSPGAGPGLAPPPLPAPRPVMAPPGNGTNGVGPGLGVGAPPPAPPGGPLTPGDAASVYGKYQAVGGGAPAPEGGGGFLQRALGLSDNRANSIKGALGAGLKAAGENAHKPGLAAFAGSMGSGIEGGKAATDKTYDQKIKYLQAAVAAQSAGDKAAYNKNYAQYLGAKLKNDTDKAAGGGKTGAWNKPDSQKFIDAQHALANDPEVKASQKLLEQTAKAADPADVAKAQATHAALIKDKEAKYLTGVGLDPATIAKNMQTPPGSRENPHVATTQKDFDAYVKPGQFYLNPRDNKVYQRKGSGGAAGESPTAAAPSSPPAPPGPMPRTMSSAAAPDDDE